MFKRIYVEITNVCNLHCRFCPGTQRPHRFMSVEEFSFLARRLQGQAKYLYLHVLGEPLLHPALPEILAAAAQLGFRTCLTTNGTLLPQALPDLLAAPGLHKISVSLHSFEGNDLPGSPEAYVTAAAQSCRTLADSGVICALRLWNNGGRQRQNREIEDHLSRTLGLDVTAVAPDVRGNRKLGQRLYLEREREFQWPHPQAPLCHTQFCLGLRQQAAVLCDGTVVPCCLDAEGHIPLGNLFHQTLPEILSSPRAQALREGFSRRRPAEELCRRCGYATRFNKD